MAGETILVVDDDEDIREIIALYLAKEGYKIEEASNGLQALAVFAGLNPDLIIMDIEVCQEIRKKTDIPIIFLSCKGEPVDKSMGLIAGGDDYMSKPFEAIELLARVKALLRRYRVTQNTFETTNTICFPGLMIDLNSYSVLVDGQPVILSPKEFQLLFLLAQNPNTVFSSEELFQAVWNTESYGDFRTVMVHISNIRKKIEKNPNNPVYVKTVKGAGYKFCTQ